MVSSLQDTQLKCLVNVTSCWRGVLRVVLLITHSRATFNDIRTLSGLARFITQPLTTNREVIASDLKSDTI